MAARTGISVGTGILIALLSVAALTFFVLFVIFFARANNVRNERDQLVTQTQEFVTQDERNRDTVRNLLTQARDSRKSLVGFLADAQGEMMQRVTGNRNDTLATFNERLSEVQGADTSPLLRVVRDRETRIANLESQAQRLNDALQTALSDQQNEVARVRAIEQRHQDTLEALNAEVGRYKDEVDEFRRGTDTARQEMDARVARLQGELDQTRQRLEEEVGRLREENLVLRGQLATLRGERSEQLFTGTPEEALRDGTVISFTPGENTVVISVGARNRVQLGMTFSVYGANTGVQPNPETGEYPRGKAALEVINVGETTSTARIVQETRGNPIVRGDIIANPIFDPNKVYKFVVFGNFDVNRDGLATAQEAEDLTSIIRGWNGEVLGDLQGDVDFLVLGERPVLPPRPGNDAPLELVQEYIRLDRIVQRYDRLLEQARATSLPVLNENRLYTLLGASPAAIR
jgi:F0F1-type ATP synthase membrane subunit b/b'